MPVFTKSVRFYPNRGLFMVFNEMRHVLQVFAENLIKTQKHASLFEKCQGLAKSMIFHGFSRNEALFATFCWKVHQNTKTCQFVRKVASFGQIDDFLWFFVKSGTFCNVLLKSSSKKKNMPVFLKSVKFWPNRLFFIKMRHFLHLFPENLIKTQKHASLFEKLHVLAKSMSFLGFSRNEALFKTFCLKVHENNETCEFVRKVASFAQVEDFSWFSRNEALFATFWWKVDQNAKTCQFVRKVSPFGQIDDFSWFLTKWGPFFNFLLKNSSKCQNMVVCSKS